jgi:hypothetical protein
MTNSNNGSNCGSNYGNNNSSWPNGNAKNTTTTKNTTNTTGTTGTTNTSTGTATGTASATATATCIEPTCGSTYSVNEIPTAGCYVCHWNGSLLRVSEAAFTTSGFTSFNFTSSDPLTVTYLTNDPTASVESCRKNATGSNVYCNF